MRADGADFYVGEEELGHIHLDGSAHVAVGRALRDVLVENGHAASFRWSKEFVVPIARRPDVAHALWVFQLRYDAIADTSAAELVARAHRRA